MRFDQYKTLGVELDVKEIEFIKLEYKQKFYELHYSFLGE
jgi:hypothetical protein